MKWKHWSVNKIWKLYHLEANLHVTNIYGDPMSISQCAKLGANTGHTDLVFCSVRDKRLTAIFLAERYKGPHISARLSG